jgi:hypothetical protein
VAKGLLQKLEELEHTLASLAGFRFYSRCVFERVNGILAV